MDSRTARVDGIAMRWEQEGDGLPLVLVHGIPTCPALWRHVVTRITGARCLAWEMVGYGGSIPEGRSRDISIARQASYLIAWMKTVGVERAVFAGHDLGGGVVQIAAVREPARCAGLFLTNSIGYDSWPIPSVKAMRALGAVVQHLPAAVFKGVFGSFIKRGHDDAARASESIDVHWPHYARHGGAAAFVRQIRALNVQDTLSVAGRLRDLRVPASGVRATAFRRSGMGNASLAISRRRSSGSSRASISRPKITPKRWRTRSIECWRTCARVSVRADRRRSRRRGADRVWDLYGSQLQPFRRVAQT